MRPWALGLAAVMAAGLALAGRAGEYNEILDIGDPAPAWSDLPGVDGQQHSLADLDDKDIVIVVFTCNSCPVAVDYEDRIIAIARDFAGQGDKAALVAINVNTIEADRLDKMQERAATKGFTFPYLFDESQQIARQYGANFTPEFFVLNRERKIVYMGGMDNNSNPQQVTEDYLRPAIEAALLGESPEITETIARGCRIRYARERRGR